MESDQLRHLWQPLVAGEQPAQAMVTVRSDSLLHTRTTTLALPALATETASLPADWQPQPVTPDSRNAVTRPPPDNLRGAATPQEMPVADARSSQFQLVQEIGRGGMGAVFKGRQLSLDREVAVKKALRPRDPSARERFLAEARVTAYLEHPNIVPVHELGQGEQEALLLVMKLVGGRSWEDILHPAAGQSTPDLDHSLGVLIEVCDAVHYAHSRGIVHCDLKPENIMVGEFGEVLLMDWGIAVDVSGASVTEARGFHPTEIGGPTGTPAYMAPEQARGQGERFGPRTDVYLLGSMLAEILTGQAPHKRDNLWSTIMAAASGQPPELPRSAPKPLRAICRRAMAGDPADRFASAKEFQEALRAYWNSRESNRFFAICTAFVTLLAFLGGAVALLLDNQFDLNDSQDVRYHSYATAMELQKSSDDLTSMARTYVMTSDASYEDRYQHILAVRNGTAERPDGTRQALVERMRELGFTEREFALLATSEQNSNALVATEEVAMHAVKGEFRDDDGAFTVTGKPDLKLAQTSMFDATYRDAKREIMAPIGEFVEVLDERTARSVKKHVQRGYIYLFAIMGILVLLMGAAIAVTVRLYRQIRRDPRRRRAIL